MEMEVLSGKTKVPNGAFKGKGNIMQAAPFLSCTFYIKQHHPIRDTGLLPQIPELVPPSFLGIGI